MRSICSSLIDLGYLDDATREAHNVAKEAKQVQSSCERVWIGITRAFDERRVRGTDVLEHVGFALAFLVVGLSFLPEAMNALFANEDKFPAQWLVPLNAMGAVALLSILLWIIFSRRRLSTLGSWRFRWRHGRLRKFLASCATGYLTRLREDGWKRVWKALDDPPIKEMRAWDKFFRAWNKQDHKLARQCARLLDIFARDRYYPPISNRRPRLIDLSWQVEQWALKALLVSERPQEFWKFPLPRLALLYRFYPMMGAELLLSSFEEKEPDVVADADVELTFLDQCGGDHEEIETIKRWTKNQSVRINRSRFPWHRARRFVIALNKVGLKAGMTRRDFEKMLEVMEKQLQRT